MTKPELHGPRVLFFSGGTALNDTARALTGHTHNCVHLVPPFDSGGSSRVLREALGMPAVGDLRSRLVALAPDSGQTARAAVALFAYRFPHARADGLRAEAEALVAGMHPLMAGVALDLRAVIRAHLRSALDDLPRDFDFRGASVGNLILAGGYLMQGRVLEAALDRVSIALRVRGTVRPVVEVPLHVGAVLRDGRVVHGQRALCGKETPAIDSPIARLFLSDGVREVPVGDVPLSDTTAARIGGAEAIVYAPGSLYSSVVANLMPAGVGQAVAARAVPKVYLPSLGRDPEALGHELADQVAAILAPLRADAGSARPVEAFLTEVLCDLSVPERACAEVTERFGVPVRRDALSTDGVHYDAGTVARTLLARLALLPGARAG